MTKAFRNFSPTCFLANPIAWCEDDLIQIEKIKADFSFDDNYDLHNHLAQLSIDSESLKEVERQTPTDKEKQIHLKELKNKIKKSKKHVDKICSALAEINKLQVLLENTGTTITSLIANKNHDNYTKIVALRDAVDFFDFNNIPSVYMKLEAIRSLSNIFPSIIEEAERNLPTIKRGPPNKPFIKGMIQLLMKIYTTGTRQETTCGWMSELGEFTEDADINGKYVGKFYDFLIAVSEIIKTKLNISMGTPNTLGKYTRELLTEINKL